MAPGHPRRSVSYGTFSTHTEGEGPGKGGRGFLDAVTRGPTRTPGIPWSLYSSLERHLDAPGPEYPPTSGTVLLCVRMLR